MDLKLRNDRGFNNRQDDGESAAPAFALYGHDKSCTRPLGEPFAFRMPLRHRLRPARRPRARAPACRGTTPSCPLPAAALAPRILARRNNAPPAPPSNALPHLNPVPTTAKWPCILSAAKMVVASHVPRQALPAAGWPARRRQATS